MLMSFVCGAVILTLMIAFLWTGVRAFRTFDEHSPRWKRVCGGREVVNPEALQCGRCGSESSARCASHEAHCSSIPMPALMCPIAGIQCRPLRNLNGIVPIDQ